MKNVYWLILSVVWVLGACSTGEAEGDSQKSNTNVSVTEVASSTSETNSVDENDKVYFINGLEYSIPESWTEKVSRENLKYYYPENGMLMVGYDEATGSITDDYSRKTYIEGISSTMENFELISESEIAVAGTRAYRHEINSVLAGKEY